MGWKRQPLPWFSPTVLFSPFPAVSQAKPRPEPASNSVAKETTLPGAARPSACYPATRYLPRGSGDAPLLTRETPSSPPRVGSILDTSRTMPGYSTHTKRRSRRSSTGTAIPGPASAAPAAILAGLARLATVRYPTRSPSPRLSGSAGESFRPHPLLGSL